MECIPINFFLGIQKYRTTKFFCKSDRIGLNLNNQSLEEINDLFDKFRISDALMAIYKLVWDDFCSSYLEIIKPGYQQPIDEKTLEQSIFF